MTPRTEKGAIEKLYRVREYLRGYTYKHLTFEEMMGRDAACESN